MYNTVNSRSTGMSHHDRIHQLANPPTTAGLSTIYASSNDINNYKEWKCEEAMTYSASMLVTHLTFTLLKYEWIPEDVVSSSFSLSFSSVNETLSML